MNDFIQAQSISFSYHVEEGQAPVNVFENLSVDIHQGEMTAVLGHNGSGKSTFAKHLNAILLPSGGKVYVDGIDTADEERLYDIRQEVGMVFQNRTTRLSPPWWRRTSPSAWRTSASRPRRSGSVWTAH